MRNKIQFIAVLLLSLVFAVPAFAQNPGVVQQGVVTAGHAAIWTKKGVIQDGGAIAVGTINSLSETSPNSTLSIGGTSPCTGPSCAFTFDLPAIVTGATVGSATVAPVLTFDNFGRVTNISSATIAPPFSAITGQASCAQLPAFTGDTTKSSGSCALTTVKVNGVAYAAAPSVDTIPVITASNVATYTAMPNCTAGALNYSTATHLFSCAAAGSGTVTQVNTGGGLTGGPITSTGTLTLRMPTVQVFNSGTAVTYTPTSGVAYIKVTTVGGGGGGGGSGASSSGGTGGTGGTSLLATSGGTTIFSATGGPGGAGAGGDTGGGTGSGGDINIPGGRSQAGSSTATTFTAGGSGGMSCEGGIGQGGKGGNMTGTAGTAGSGGGGGGCSIKYISPPAASYLVTVGTAGTAGAAGTSGAVGVAGTAGAVFIEEF